MITSLNTGNYSSISALGKPDKHYSFINFQTISYTLLKNLAIMAEKGLFVIKSVFNKELCKTILLEKQFN